MKFHALQTILAVSAHLLATACGSASGGNAADMRIQNTANRALTENALNNATYRIDELGTFKLENGEFKHRYGVGMTQMHSVILEKAAFGDLDDDGLGDAAVVLTWQSGGSGTYKYLLAMLNNGNAPRQQDSVLLGDRVQIAALSIDAGLVSIDMLTIGPCDPICCPTHQVKQHYMLRDGKWVQNADKINIRMHQ